MEALSALSDVLGAADCPHVLVGATARMVMLDRYVLRSGSALIRRTRDVDAAIQVAGWGEFQTIMTSLRGAGFAPTKLEHRLIYKGVEVDIMPYDESSGTYLVWPKSQMKMSLLGLKEAFASAQEITLRPNLTLRVASIPAFVLLKIISYRDRSFQRDLEDIWFCLKYYEENGGTTRRFDCADVTVEGEWLTFEEAGAYLIGLDLKAIITPEAKKAACTFLTLFRSLYSPAANILLGILNLLGNGEDQRKQISRRFLALAKGLGC